MNEMVLLYNFSGTPAGQKLKPILLKLRLRVRIVKPEEYLKPIGHLAGLKTIPGNESRYDGEPLPEPMLLMKGFTEPLLDTFLMALRKQKLVIPLKAVLTEQNAAWDSLTLYNELKKEHELMIKREQEL